MSDPDLLSIRDEVALLQVRLGELVGRLGTGEGGSLWADLKAALRRCRAALASGDQAALGQAVAEVDRLVTSGADAEDAWAAVVRAINDKTRVAAREWRRLVDLQQLMPAEQVLTIVGAIAASVRRHLEALGAPGREALRAFSADMTALMNARRAEGRRPIVRRSRKLVDLGANRLG